MRCPFPLKADDSGLFRCYGRVPGYNPIFVPRKHSVAIRGSSRFQATRSMVRDRSWIPLVRRMVESVRAHCNQSKKTIATPLDSPITSRLTSFRTNSTQPFSATGVIPFTFFFGSFFSDVFLPWSVGEVGIITICR